MGEIPRNSPAMAMVLAVNWPPQAPAPGQAPLRGLRAGVVDLTGGVRADAFEDSGW